VERAATIGASFRPIVIVLEVLRAASRQGASRRLRSGRGEQGVGARECVRQLPPGTELLGGPASTFLPVIIAGDLNTGPLVAGIFLTPTYQNILASGFTDAWTVTNPGVPGMTNAFHAEDPYGPSVPDKCIDLVLANGGLRSVSVTLTGTSAVHGLWPSDHAGVIAIIQIPS